MKNLNVMMMTLMMCFTSVLSFSQTKSRDLIVYNNKTIFLTTIKNKNFIEDESLVSFNNQHGFPQSSKYLKVIFLNNQTNELVIEKEMITGVNNVDGQLNKEYEYYTLPINTQLINNIKVPHTNESQEFYFYYQKVKASKTEYLMSIITGLAGTFIYSHGVINQQPSSRNFGGALIVIGCGLTLTAYITDWSSIKHLKNLSTLNSQRYR